MRFTIIAALLATPALAQTYPIPPAITAEGVPAIPAALAATARPYFEYRTAAFQGWDARSRAMLIATRFGSAAQLHSVATPGAARTQISFEAEPVRGSPSPDGSSVVVIKDIGGGEFFQLYTLAKGQLTLLTDGKSRNTGPTWRRDGKLIGYTSTRRNGTDGDLYVVDPADPKSDRMIAERQGGGWSFADFAPDGKTALITHYLSIERSELHELDLTTGKLTQITPKAAASYSGARYAPDGTIYVTCDQGSDFQRLGRLDRNKGFQPLSNTAATNDIEEFAAADDGSFIAAVLNDAGASRLRLIDPKTGATTAEAKLPAGVITGLQIAPWGEIGFSLASATSPADAWSLDPKTLAVRRWTTSETGGLDAAQNVEPELITARSFDGLTVSGFLYRPSAARHPGKRPLIIDIHGGPEGQTRPGFLGRTNQLVNELGLAIFYPNVRGSTGYGKRFVGLDNGPFQRENSVKDVGALMDVLAARPEIDSAKMAVTGGSYGGYMCYASAIRYAARLKGAVCARAISNFVSLLENTESYRRDLRRAEYGDERDPRSRAKLLEISPLTRVAELKMPLLIITGSNDPRVKPSESTQLVDAVRAQGGTAWHVIAANEGHGYLKKENQDYQFLATLAFWQQVLLR